MIKLILLSVTGLVLQSCSCAISMHRYQPVSKNKTISPFLVAEFAKAKRYKGDADQGYYKHGTSLTSDEKGIILYNSFCPNPLTLIIGKSSYDRWVKHLESDETELKEWFHAMEIPLKYVKPVSKQ